MTQQTIYINTDDRYGDPVQVTIEDYRQLNPNGDFDQGKNGIYESGEPIARPATPEHADEHGATVIVSVLSEAVRNANNLDEESRLLDTAFALLDADKITEDQYDDICMAAMPTRNAKNEFIPYTESALGVGTINTPEYLNYDAAFTPEPEPTRRCNSCGRYLPKWEFTTIKGGDVCDGCL